MAKMMLHDDEARAALGRGVSKLARAVRGTLGPKGMNAIIDRPVGTPIVSRDGVSIAQEIELACPFENMGAQVLRRRSSRMRWCSKGWSIWRRAPTPSISWRGWRSR
jgi:chaperonin GroEL